MWRIPLSLIAGGTQQAFTITSDELIGNLWVWMGSPSVPVNVTLTIDNADVGNIYVPADFTAGSTFQITCINGGRVLGLGGDGGVGGNDTGATGTAGGGGDDGGAAISSEGWTINVDVDNGFLFGGGSGGGGGGAADRGATADAGGGGGGGQGWTGGTGGTGGTGSTPSAENGVNGLRSASGAGGGGGGVTAPFPDGGAGGNWGEAGVRGYHDSEQLRAGVAGIAGNAFLPVSGAAAINYNGSLTEAQLRSTGRLKGETEGLIVLHPFRNAFAFHPSTSAILGWQWENDGQLEKLDGIDGSVFQDGYFWRDTLNGIGIANFDNTIYEIIQDSATREGTWDAQFPTEDTYYALSTDRTLSFTTAINQETSQMVRIRRTAAAGGDGGDLAMGYYKGWRETV